MGGIMSAAIGVYSQSRLYFMIRLAFICSVALAMSGCSTIKVWMGTRVRLEKTPVVSLQANLPQGPEMFPGEKTPLVVTVMKPNGEVLLTEGAGEGKVLWEDIQVASNIVTVNPDGIVTLPIDPRISDGKTPHLSITVPSHPGIHTELDIHLRYNQSFISDFSGHAGRSGMDGTDGMSGSSGNSGSTDALNPSSGGDGSNGSDGSDGSDGRPGEDAPPVQVRLTIRPGERPLLQACVSGPGQDEYFLVDPNGGSLTIKAEGGAGGSGGRGGRGGRGGSGGSGITNGLSGMDGSDGRDGWSGPAGKGGAITVRFDPGTRRYLSLLHFSTLDGNGKPGPVPIFTEETILPLW
jgi:hypothetical protein